MAWGDVSPLHFSFQMRSASPIGPEPRRPTAPPMETRSFIRVVTATRHPSPWRPSRAGPGHVHVGEEDLVEFCFTGDLVQGPHLDTGAFHVDQERGDALVLGHIGIGPGQQEPEPGQVGQRRPDLLPVEDPLITVGNGPGREARHIGPRAGLAEQLAPDLLRREQRAQVALLLLVRAVGDDRRRTHAVADRILDPAVRGAGRRQPGLRLLVILERQPEAAVPHRIVQPGQPPVELRPQELLGRCGRRWQVGQEFIDKLFHVRAHGSTL